MSGRSHLSIGEVLSLLQEEFPDVTISKIRFLESQGLVDPERTPSGYRKFYEPDIDRLRWVLRQQRDAFLPLKVIKGRLEGTGSQLSLDGLAQANGEAEEMAAGPASSEPSPLEAAVGAGSPAGAEPHASTGERPAEAGAGSRARRSVAGEVERPEQPARTPSTPDAPPPGPPQVPAPKAGPVAPGRAPRPAPARAAHAGGVAQGTGAAVEDELSLDELVEAAPADAETVRDLERYGLVSTRSVAGTTYYGRDAVVIARLAEAFARHGVEARHLRAYKGAADREAGLVAQVIGPLVRQRNPEARQAAAEAVEELSRLGGELRDALLRIALSSLR